MALPRPGWRAARRARWRQRRRTRSGPARPGRVSSRAPPMARPRTPGGQSCGVIVLQVNQVLGNGLIRGPGRGPIAGNWPNRDEAWLRLARWARWLAWVSLAWMTIEGAVGLAAGISAA